METSGSESASTDDLEYEHLESGNSQSKLAAADFDLPKSNHKSWRKWAWAILAGYIVLQTYYVREMLAALLLFTVFFAVFALIATIVYIIGRAGEAGILLAEPAAKRGVVLAEELSKKTFHRPRSAPVP